MDSPWPDDPTKPRAPEASPGHTRFNSCRWQRPAEGDQPACCGHRDVLPMAGTTGFNPESWCVDCTYFKMKRAPKPRPATPPRPWD